jgi:hypothetical protein
MKKIIIGLAFVLCILTNSFAQLQLPYVLGYSAGEQVEHKGSAIVGDTFKISFSGGAPFATQ